MGDSRTNVIMTYSEQDKHFYGGKKDRIQSAAEELGAKVYVYWNDEDDHVPRSLADPNLLEALLEGAKSGAFSKMRKGILESPMATKISAWNWKKKCFGK